MQQRQLQQRAYSQPQQNWGQIRRQQAFDAKRERDILKAQERANRDEWKYQRKQQHFEDKADRQQYRQYQPTFRPYYRGDDRDSWITGQTYGRDYSNRDYPSYSTQQPYWNYGYQQPYQQPYSNYGYQPYSNYGYQPYSNYGYQTYNYYPTYGIFDYADDYNPYYSSYGYNGLDWKSLLFRSVIAAFFGNADNYGYLDPYPQYSYYNTGYGYEPIYSDYYQPSYYTFGYEPAYSYYEPAAYYGYDQYAGYGLPLDSYYGPLPYGDLQDIYSGGIAGELIQRALGTGYYQGLLEGQLARRRGWGDRYYYDPYLYEQAIYDPYSTSLGDCRRYFSEGYEIGYQDALRGRDEFDLAHDGGDIDLVSLLLGNALSLRG
jgi:hypothetical protein